MDGILSGVTVFTCEVSNGGINMELMMGECGPVKNHWNWKGKWIDPGLLVLVPRW